jgi:chromosome segregation ATPase
MSIWAKLSGNSAFNTSQGPVETENPNENKKYYYSSSSGQMVSTDGRGYVIPDMYDIVAEKHDFIPKELAAEKLKAVLKDANAMKNTYEENVNTLHDHYHKVLNDSKSHYEKLIDELKKKAVRHVDIQRQLKQQLEEKLTKELNQSEDKLEELRDNMANLNRQHQDDVRKLKTKNAELDSALQSLITQTKDREIQKQTKFVLDELVNNIESQLTSEFYKDTITSMSKDMAVLIEDYNSTVTNERQQHEMEFKNFTQNSEIRKDCTEVMEYLLATLEITEMSGHLQSVALLTMEISDLKQSIALSQEQLLAKENEIIQLSEIKQQLEDIIELKNKEISDLMEEREKEKLDSTSSHDSLTQHLKSKFNTVLKQMKSKNDEMEIKLCLSDLIGNVIMNQVEELSSSLTALQASAANSQEMNKLSKDYEKKMQLLQKELNDNRQKVSELLEEKESSASVASNSGNPQLSKKIQKLQDDRDRLEVEVTLMSMVNKISERNFARTILGTTPSSVEDDKEKNRLRNELKQLKQQLSKAHQELETAKSTAAPAVNPEILRLTQKIETLVQTIQELEKKLFLATTEVKDATVERDNFKIQIKDWTTQFREENGREPEVADKALIRDKYQNYKITSLKVKDLETGVLELQKTTEERKAELVQLQEQLVQLQAATGGVGSSPTLRQASVQNLTRLASSSQMVARSVAEMVDAEVQVIAADLRAILAVPKPTEDDKPKSPREEKAEMADITKQQFDELQQQQIEAMEQLEDQLFAMKEDISKLKTANQEIETERSFLSSQLETLIKEKRTDVVKRFEEEITELNKKSSDLEEQTTHLTIEKQKLETRVTELRERAERAEQELRDRDAREQQAINPNEEKHQLKGQINKQRDAIILKAKAATAGWDAAASADEKLEIEVQKAYQKGLKEEKEKHKSDLDSVHGALETKETRITDLLVSIADMEKRVMKAESEKKEMAAQVEALKLEVADAISGIQMIAAANAMRTGGGAPGAGGGEDDDGEIVIPPSAAELESARDQLDNAQEELVGLMDRCDRLEAELEVARKKNRIFERLAGLTGLVSGKAAPVGGGAGGGRGGDGATDYSKYDLNDVISNVKKAITKGTNLWKSNLKDQCYDVYLESCLEIPQRIMTEDLSKPVRDAIESGKVLGASNKQRGAVTFRKALDKFLSDASQPNFKNNEEMAVMNARSKLNASVEEQSAVNNSLVGELVSQLDNIDSGFLDQGYTKEKNPGNSSNAGTIEHSPREQSGGSLLMRAKSAEAQVTALRKQLAAVIAATANNAPAAGGGGGGEGGAARPSTALKRAGGGGAATTAVVGGGGGGGMPDPAEVRRLNRKIKDLEQQLKNKESSSSAGVGGAEIKAMQLAEKQLQKKLKDQETLLKRESKNLEMRAAKAENALTKIQGTYNTIVSERDSLKQENSKLFNMTSEIGSLKLKAEKCDELETVLQQKDQEFGLLQEQFKKESQLRKKYKNDLEDLKGAIRVYARCRPMAKYELERGCKTVVDIKDENSMKLITSRGEKEFDFDAVFSATSTQDQVFEDTKRLVESCLDGFNVCVFAYGQTGSGKTFTMTGSPSMPGLTPKAIYELYRLIDEKVHLQVKVTTYFVELYNDNLCDLFWQLDNAGAKKGPEFEPPKLEIKMDAKKMVFIRNAVIKDVSSPEELMVLFEKGNLERHTGATKMNAESSRSHSIFAIMVECYDTNSKKTITGKLSLVDLAGSERADKTGASAERLR